MIDLILLTQANTARFNGEHHEALSIYLKLSENGFNDIHIALTIASLYFSLSLEKTDMFNHQQALQWLDRAEVIDAQDTKCYTLRGNILEYGIDAPDYTGALTNYRHALALDSTNTKAALGIAGLIGIPDNLVSLDEAIMVIEKSITPNTDDPIVFLRLGTLLREAHKEEQAQYMYDRALLCSDSLKPEYTGEINKN